MTAVLLTGALFGLGILLAARGLRGTPITATVGGSGLLAAGLGDRFGPTVLLGARILRLDPGRRHSADLVVVARSVEDHAARSVLAGMWLVALVVLVAAWLTAGGVAVPGGLITGGVLLGALGGPLITTVVLKAEATERRRDLLVDLAAYSDLVVLLLAAGSGVEEALTTGAEAGDGWMWRQIRDALRNARLIRQTPAEALTGLGRRIGVVELEELGAAVALASSSGSRLRESLAARSEALRTRELARIQAQAASATERMTFPVVALALGFLVVLGFPAVSRVLSGF
jgi:tight adherence protein C